MKFLFGFFLLLLESFFMSITIDDSIIGNSILKIMGFLCIYGFAEIFQEKNKNLY